jgi:hypothetical protein
MADPVLNDIKKVQVVFQGPTGLPEDQYVNTWYFRNDMLPPEDGYAQMKTVLDRFYTGVNPNGQIVAGLLAGYINAAFNYHMYDLGQAPPRVRTTLAAVPLTARTAGGFPAEVAVCSSYYAGVNRPRRRGRHYIGPLAYAVGSSVPSNSEQAVTVLARQTIAQAALDVASTSLGVTWVLVTRGGVVAPVEPASAQVVTAGWVDDAFDIQRRRGRKAAVRTAWVG